MAEYKGKLVREDRLAGVHPALVRVVRAAVFPWDVVVLEGERSVQRQARLVAAGASWTMESRHIRGADGYAHAVDLAPRLDTDGDGNHEVSWAWPPFHVLAERMRAAAAAEGVEIEWGGDWHGVKADGPHWQLPRGTYP